MSEQAEHEKELWDTVARRSEAIKNENLQDLMIYCQETGACLTITPEVTDRVRFHIELTHPAKKETADVHVEAEK